MPCRTEVTSIIGSFAMLIAANTQAVSQTSGASPFDGAYTLVSSTSLVQTSVTRSGDMGTCPEMKPGMLNISEGQVSYVTPSGRQLAGAVTAQGIFEIRVMEPGGSRPLEMDVNGVVDGSGVVRARQRGNSCSYDLVWQKRT
jgi:hypothetical protein